MDKILKLFFGLLPTILGAMSPEIRAFITTTIRDLAQRAKQTKNPFDDLGVQVLAGILGVDLD